MDRRIEDICGSSKPIPTHISFEFTKLRTKESKNGENVNAAVRAGSSDAEASGTGPVAGGSKRHPRKLKKKYSSQAGAGRRCNQKTEEHGIP